MRSQSDELSMPDTPHVLDAEALRHIANSKPGQCTCALQACCGWESVSDDRWPEAQMAPAGTLRQPVPEGQTELTFEEFHPDGTRYESPRAHIAPGYFPFNRCDVFACTRCGCAVLKYTEYGGYYVDHRVRLVDADLVVDR
jgi:hypothetical protein